MLSGCTTTPPTNRVLLIDTADIYVGINETDNTEVLKHLMNVDPIEYAWCAGFVNSILRLNGLPESDTYLIAKSFLNWGNDVQSSDIQKGDIVVLNRGTEEWQGHVGFYIETKMIDGVEHYVLLGGNQDDSVSYKEYESSRVLGIRRYSSAR